MMKLTIKTGPYCQSILGTVKLKKVHLFVSMATDAFRDRFLGTGVW